MVLLAFARLVTKTVFKKKIIQKALKFAKPVCRRYFKKKAVKNFTKRVLKKAPGISVCVGVASGVQRILCDRHDKKRYLKAGAEIASGLVNTLAGPAGPIVSFALDAGLFAVDLQQGQMEIETERPAQVHVQNYHFHGDHQNTTMNFGNGQNQVGDREENPQLSLGYL